jgi:hypothetical protein
VHIKAVADLLGHSIIAISGDFYGHVSDATTRAAVDGPASTVHSLFSGCLHRADPAKIMQPLHTRRSQCTLDTARRLTRPGRRTRIPG